MWRFTRNNAITEGFHTKMEVLQRQTYGFRNFQNYGRGLRCSVLDQLMDTSPRFGVEPRRALECALL